MINSGRKYINVCKFIFLFFLFYAPIINAQSLPNFTLAVATTPETCAGNGTVTFSVTGTDPAATITYNIYDANNTFVNSTQLNIFSSLAAGNYTVTATQAKNGYNSNSVTQFFTIKDSKQKLVFTAIAGNKGCSVNNATITVNVTGGSAPFSYSLKGSVNIGPQSSNIFSGLSSGNDTVFVTDGCGNTDPRQVLVTSNNTAATTTIGGFNCTSLSRTICDSFPLSVNFSSNIDYNNILFPINAVATITLYDGTVIQNNLALNSASDLIKTFNLPYYEGKSYTVNIAATATTKDMCNNTVDSFNTTFTKAIQLSGRMVRIDCYNQYIVIDNNNLVHPSFQVVSAPPAYTGSTLPNSLNTIGDANNSVPYGIYKVEVKDSCGLDSVLSFDVEKPITNALYFNTYSSCNAGNGGFEVEESPHHLKISQFKTARLISAPTTFPYSLPYDLLKNITTDSFYIIMNDVPEGTYKIQETNHCDEGNTYTVSLTGYKPGNDSIKFIPGCSNFNVYVKNATTNAGPNYYLQKYYPAYNVWSNPNNYAGLNSSDPTLSQNSISLFNIGLNYNFYYPSGDYRVMKMHLGSESYNNGGFSREYCIDTLYAFTYIPPNHVSIKNIYGLPCPNGLINVNITVQDGYPPYKYSITQKDGSVYYINNGTSGLFQNLSKGIYTFSISDSCGNITTRKFEITKLNSPKITALNICDGQNGKLSLPEFPLISYKWWKETDPSNIISTSYYYDFTPFKQATDTGTYYAVMASTLGNGCIADTMVLHIGSNILDPNAGNDTAVSICHTTDMVNLSNLLSAKADKNGTWYETSNSNLLTDCYWFPSSASSGTYYFKYIAGGLCSGSDTSLLTITVIDTPALPTISNIINQNCTSIGSVKINNLPSQSTWSIHLNPNNIIINGTGSTYLLDSLNQGFDTIQVSNITGCSSSKVKFYVPFTNNLNLQITSKANDSICYGKSSNISAQTNGSKFSWVPVTALSDTTSLNPVASPVTSTKYYIISSLGICTKTDSALITVNPLPDTLLVKTIQPDCSISTGSIKIMNGATGNVFSVNNGRDWQAATNFGNLNPNTYYVAQKDKNGCISPLVNVAILLHDLTPTIPQITDITTPVCTQPLGTAKLNGLPSDGWTINFSNGNIYKGIATDTTIQSLSPAATYTCTVSNSQCTSDTFNFTIPTFVNNLYLRINTNDTTVCANSSTQLSVSSNGSEYSWTPVNNIDNASIVNPIVSPLVNTMYIIKSDLGICTKYDSVKFTVNPLPTAHVSSDTSVCHNQNAQLHGSGGTLYQWSPITFLSNKNSSDPQVIQPTYDIIYSLKVTDNNGCTSSNVAQTTVSLYPQVVINTDYVSDVAFSEQVQLQAKDVNNVGIADYSWSPIIGLSDSHVQNPMLTVGYIDNYTVTALSKDGCYGTGSVSLRIFSKPDIFAPSAFSPNNDGTNDIFKPIPVAIKTLTAFAVFDRYGNKIYETHELNKGWDGTYNGVKQSSGTYVWYAEAITLFNERIFKKGTVVLIR